MLLHKTPKHAKFCGDRLKNARDIRHRKCVLPEKVGQSSPKILGDATLFPQVVQRHKLGEEE